MCCVLNISASCLSLASWSHWWHKTAKLFWVLQRKLVFLCVVETSCGWAEPQAIWMHCSCVVAFFLKDYDSIQPQPVCLFTLQSEKKKRQKEQHASRGYRSHGAKVPHNDSEQQPLTSTFRFPVAAASCVHPCMYLQPRPGINWN